MVPAITGLPEALRGVPRCLIMGVVNVTPDSFSDGGNWFETDAAIAHGLELVAQGADLVDVGGESTDPAPTGCRRPRSAVACCRWCASSAPPACR